MGEDLPKLARSAYGLTVRAALRLHAEHPEITQRRDALLCEMLRRQGLILERLGGELLPEFVPLTNEWVRELEAFAIADDEVEAERYKPYADG